MLRRWNDWINVNDKIPQKMDDDDDNVDNDDDDDVIII